MSDAVLHDLAELVGILPRYRDLSAVEHVASVETKRALLGAMGIDADRPAEALAGLQAARSASFPLGAVVVPADEPSEVTVGDGEIAWQVSPDPRTMARDVQGQSCEGRIALPPLPVGLHIITVADRRTLIVAAPATAPDLSALGLEAPRWGVTAALYGLRSETNGGIGTYRDLAAAAAALGWHGADFLGINPVHALGAAGGTISPYSPTHRAFLNTDHVAPRHLGDAAAALRQAAYIDYPASRRVLDMALRAEFAALEPIEALDLRAFRERTGSALEDFATFEALSLTLGADWRAWPEDLRHPRAPAVGRFAAENAEEVAYHAFLQWRADTQLAEAQRVAVASGMALGLYADLAIGVRPDAAEIWAEPRAFARGVSLGTPPDQFNAQGQVWGLAPMSPLGLAEDLYRSFIDTIRAAVGHAGIARIDHVLGFMRCFWVPEDGAPGAYVRYPTDVLLAITKVEAAHAGCLVIGEDLGVLPEGLRERLAEARLYGCSVAQFERQEDGDLRHPREFRPHTLASFSTHDTPTARGFWRGWDIERQSEFGQLDDETAAAAQQRRDWDRRRLHWLVDGGTDAPATDLDPAAIARLHALIGDGASELVAVQLDDVLARLEQPNFPGTVDEYPNWRLKCPATIGELQNIPELEPVRRAVDTRRARDK